MYLINVVPNFEGRILKSFEVQYLPLLIHTLCLLPKFPPWYYVFIFSYDFWIANFLFS